MADNDKHSFMLIDDTGRPADRAAAQTSDIVLETAPGFAVASLMISSAQAQSRAIEAAVAQLIQTYHVGLATSTQCVVRILDEPSRQQDMLSALIAGNKI